MKLKYGSGCGRNLDCSIKGNLFTLMVSSAWKLTLRDFKVISLETETFIAGF